MTNHNLTPYIKYQLIMSRQLGILTRTTFFSDFYLKTSKQVKPFRISESIPLFLSKELPRQKLFAN